MKEVGVVISPTAMGEFEFVLTGGEAVSRGDYCIIKHPINGANCLARVFSGETRNPEMLPVSFGPILARRGIQLGKEQEVVILRAELLGYKEPKTERFTRMDFPPSPGSTVYLASPETIGEFQKYQEGIQVKTGVEAYSRLPISLSLDLLTKGHVGVYGQTRSGKTCFVMGLMEAFAERDTPGRFIVFDRYGEYKPLLETGRAKQLDYRELLSLEDLRARAIVSMLGLETRRASGKALMNAIEELKKDRQPLDPDSMLEKASGYVTRDKERIVSEIERSFATRKDIVDKIKSLGYEAPDVINLLKEYPITIIDTSTDPDIRAQQSVFALTLRGIFTRAVATKGEEITCMVVVEEAQFYAPEKGGPLFGDPFKTGSLNALAAGCSQLGGFNVGFVVMTQRPAYVSKAILAQCNTHVIFRLMSGADHEQVASVIGYPRHRIAQLVSALQDHVALVVGMGAPFEFPVFIETEVRRYPRKATMTASEVLKKQQELKAGSPDK